MSRNALIFAVSLPLLVIAIGIVRAEHHLATSRAWLFDVAGYDPRDLLRGRYIQFRLELNEQEPREACTDEMGDHCCLCLTDRGVDQTPKVERATCATALRACDGALQVQTLKDLRRYYIPEHEAWKLEQRFQDAALEQRAKLKVAINDEGKPQIQALLIDGESIVNSTP